ncbi:MAG: Cof-type HAD-IIB family hydrolase [Anaerococcus sp.]|nr:Cof-type HAD-IIB family hydrolase [Anaerococcus sp.]
MKKDIKLIVFDVDGTLVNDKKEILDESIKVIDKLKKKGIRIVLNSGRTFNGMWRMRQRLNLMGFDDYSICGTGAFIRRNADGKAILENPLYEKDYKEVINLVEGYDVQVTIHTMNIFYLNEEVPNEAFIKDQRQVQLPWMKFEKFSDIEKSVSRIGITGDKEILDEIYAANKEELEKSYKLMRNEDYLLEVLNKKAGKSKSLRKLCDFLGISKDEVMYFGDGLNDARSLSFAGTSIAMENAHPKAKEAAQYLIGSNNAPSIAGFLRKYFDLDE